METIAHRDLRNRSSELLRRVAAGESFVVTNHGTVVAHLTPAAAAAPGRLALRRATSSEPFTVPGDRALPPGWRGSAAELDDLRGDR